MNQGTTITVSVNTLEDLRKINRKSLSEVARLMGVSRSYMFYLEKAQRNLSLEQAERMARIYNTDISVISSLYAAAKRERARKINE